MWRQQSVARIQQSILSMLVTLILLISCSVDDEGFEATAVNQNFVYYLVTHGPSTDSGFWGDVLIEARSQADLLGVGLVPLHPAVETSGELLNSQMSLAISANPPGIVATIWGQGMAQIVKTANSRAIPLAAINVYPDPAEFGPGKAEFLLYAGQNDASAAEDVTAALICGAQNLHFTQGDCEGRSMQQVFAELNTPQLHAICLISQQSGGVLARCQAMKKLLIEQLGLAQSQYIDLVWNEANVGEGATAIADAVEELVNSGAEKILILSQGDSTTGAYLNSNVHSNFADKITIGTFDINGLICDAIDSGKLLFASDQGHKLQGKMALDYLHHYVTQGVLPAQGVAPDGSPDERWTISPDGFPWYKTGPNLLYGSCD